MLPNYDKELEYFFSSSIKKSRGVRATQQIEGSGQFRVLSLFTRIVLLPEDG